MAQTQILMLQPDAFYEHTIQQNTSPDGAPPRTRCGSLQSSPESLADFKGAALRFMVMEKRAMEGRGGEGKGGEGRKGRAADWLKPASKLYSSNFQTPKSKLPRT